MKVMTFFFKALWKSRKAHHGKKKIPTRPPFASLRLQRGLGKHCFLALPLYAFAKVKKYPTAQVEERSAARLEGESAAV